VLESNRNGRHRERPNQIKPSIGGWDTKQIWLSSMFPFPLLSGPLILPLPCLQPTHCIPSNKYISFFIWLTLISQAIRKGKENLRALGIGGIRKTLNQISIYTIMLSFMFLFLVLLETFFLFLAHPSRPQICNFI